MKSNEILFDFQLRGSAKKKTNCIKEKNLRGQRKRKLAEFEFLVDKWSYYFLLTIKMPYYDLASRLISL